MKERFYFKLCELDGGTPVTHETDDVGMYEWLRTVIPNFPTALQRPDDVVSKKLFKAFWREICNRFIAWLDIYHSPWEPLTKEDVMDDGRWDADLEGILTEWAVEVWNIFENTKDYYYTIIPLYEDKKAHLMDKIKNEVRFNDTPQNTPIAGGYDTDEYTTTVTTSATDGSTVMDRLKEIQDNLRNLYADWVEDFVKKLCLEVDE